MIMDKKKILIVDDEKSLSLILKKCLEQTGNYDVKVENHSVNALSMARDFQPALILLDIMMPDINGIEIAEHIQNDETLKNIKIVFFTAIPIKQERKIIEQRHIDGVIINKPVKLEELLECFQEQLGSVH